MSLSVSTQPKSSGVFRMKTLSKKQKLYSPDGSVSIDEPNQGVLFSSNPETYYPEGLALPDQAKRNALFRMIDSLTILATSWLACFIGKMEWAGEFSWIALAGIILYQVAAEYNEVYNHGPGSNFGIACLSLLKAWIVTCLFFVGVSYSGMLAQSLPSDAIVFWLLWTPVALILWHGLVRFCLSIIRRKGYPQRDVAVVGATELGQRLENIFKDAPELGMRFLGYYDDRVQDRPMRLSNDEIQFRGDLNGLIEDARNGTIKVLYIVLPMAAGERIRKLVEKLSDCTVSIYLVPNLFGVDPLQTRWSTVRGIPAVSIYDSPFYGFDAWVKRSADVILSILILMLIAFPMAVVAMAVKLSSPGPVIFKQWRYGIYGEKFKIYKFRTMKVSDDDLQVTQAIKGDPRLIGVGAFLRRTSLDELPQFINVLKGDMSIVGPRPHAVPHNEFYRRKINGYMLRHKVKPGITGLAQIKGFRGETKTVDKMVGRVKYDLDYIKKWSLGLDLKIIFLTCCKGIIGKNTY